MSKKIFITGASGFTGKYLIKELLKHRGLEITAAFHSQNGEKELLEISPSLKLTQMDLTNSFQVKKIFEDLKPDEIYHLAALSSAKQSFDNPEKVLTTNIASELNLLESLNKLKIDAKVIVVTSAEVYGIVEEKNIPIDEDTPLNPTNPYAVSKIAQDYLALQYYLAYGSKIIRIRPFNHIGPGQSDKFVASAFAKKIAEIEKGKSNPVIKVGNLKSERDFTDVRDMVRAYILLMEKGKVGDVYNIGSGRSYKIEEVLKMLLSFSKKNIEVKIDSNLLRPTDNPILRSNNSKMHSITGWESEIPLEKTLQDILEYWRETI